MSENETFVKEYQPDGQHSYNFAYPVMSFAEYENVLLIGHVVSILNKDDIAQETDVEKYSKLHPEFELILG